MGVTKTTTERTKMTTKRTRMATGGWKREALEGKEARMKEGRWKTTTTTTTKMATTMMGYFLDPSKAEQDNTASVQLIN